MLFRALLFQCLNYRLQILCGKLNVALRDIPLGVNRRNLDKFSAAKGHFLNDNLFDFTVSIAAKIGCSVANRNFVKCGTWLFHIEESNRFSINVNDKEHKFPTPPIQEPKAQQQFAREE